LRNFFKSVIWAEASHRFAVRSFLGKSASTELVGAPEDRGFLHSALRVPVGMTLSKEERIF
jgi:hypothetical protein